jgi:[glutamine synthetase] adenylyltransferase / [glutamine synthetase]-adenylyl-L-tyrosine phosphorylase
MANEAANAKPFFERIVEAPAVADAGSDLPVLASMLAKAREAPELAELAGLLTRPGVAALLAGTLNCSPFLSSLINRNPARLQRILTSVPEELLQTIQDELSTALEAAATRAEAMKALRLFKAEMALLTALADLGGVWAVMEVTAALTRCADAAIDGAVRFLFRNAAARGQWLGKGDDGSVTPDGYIVLAMGKGGAGELNYSSDVDLIIFYDLEAIALAPDVEPSEFFVRLTRDLVQLLEERTADGYVFRTDLRLRPDPGATQVALSTEAALLYYESFGQNWERAALIKARPCAGDKEAGRLVVKELAPFIWRKYLDFAAIADIHAMKRQIHAHRGFGKIAVAGHNIKVGRGGIREIEFFVQTQQLIAGGRQPELRTPQTLEALRNLAERGWIKADVGRELAEAYVYLRRIEHRLQMIADEQTQEIPTDPARLQNLAWFSGYPDFEAFSNDLVRRLKIVQGHYVALFEDSPDLSSSGGSMVFAGDSDDPSTVAALAALGYKDPARVLETVRGWHHGRYAAVRTARARERLTEVQPLLIEVLADTTDPDRALVSFNKFVSDLPAGVQLFSLLRANPALLRLLADIMGSAPRLAHILSRRRRLLDAVLDPGTLGMLPTADELDSLIAAEVGTGEDDLQYALDRARVVGSEQQFLIGIRVLSGALKANEAGGAYALLAERLIDHLKKAVTREIERAHGCVPGGAAAVIAMGKLGGREMTAASDLDLIVVYDFDPDATQSDGERPSPPSQYYTRLTQRLISALSVPTAEGTLYEVDMRLRPSGQQGPVATQLSSFVDYQAKEAWTWEHMALTRARVVAGPPELRAKVEETIRHALTQPHDRAKVIADVHEMRNRVFKDKGSDDIWELKQVRGGLVDLEFIAQYLQLAHAHAHPEVLDQNTVGAYRRLSEAGLLTAAHAEVLIPAAQLVNDLTQILRLCLEGPFNPETAPTGMKELLAHAGGETDFAALEARLKASLAAVTALFDEIIA